MENVEFEILKLCKKKNLKNEDIEFLDYVFLKNIIDKNYCIAISNFWNVDMIKKNVDMIKILTV